MKKVYKIIELSQEADGEDYFHYINYDVVAICESKLAAEQEIDAILQHRYEAKLAQYEKNPEYFYDKLSLDAKDELKNSILLLKGFGESEEHYEEYERFIIEEAPLILENVKAEVV